MRIAVLDDWVECARDSCDWTVFKQMKQAKILRSIYFMTQYLEKL